MDATTAVVTSAIASFMLAGIFVLTADTHGRYTMDAPGAVQKFHLQPTPRIGGLGIYLAFAAATRLVRDAQAQQIVTTLLVGGLPALLAGLLEDVTKRIPPGARLLATLCSGALACQLGGVWIVHTAVPGFDSLLAFAPFALAFTAFAVAGLANAINMIDGFHGLASGTTVIALLALAVIAAGVGDAPLALVAVLLAAALAGFWLVNFPWGKLFLGDGGAYFAGLALGWVAVLLPARNPMVSPWASLLVCAYPVTEALYSVARRWLHHQSPAQADSQHLHSLVARRVIQPRLRRLDPTLQNAAVSVLMWTCAAIPALAAVALHANTALLVASLAGWVLLYHWLYRLVTRP